MQVILLPPGIPRMQRDTRIVHYTERYVYKRRIYPVPCYITGHRILHPAKQLPQVGRSSITCIGVQHRIISYPGRQHQQVAIAAEPSQLYLTVAEPAYVDVKGVGAQVKAIGVYIDRIFEQISSRKQV